MGFVLRRVSRTSERAFSWQVNLALICAPMKETQEVTDRDTEIVSRIRARLVAQLGEDRFELWFGTGTRLSWNHGALWISADTAFRVDRLRRGLLSEIQRVVSHELGQDVAVNVLR